MSAAPNMEDTNAEFAFRNLPARLSSFVGREQELGRIAELLQDPDCRLLTLLGPGGSGKTRLAVEAARAEAGSFAHGACFVALGAVESVDAIASAVADALGLQLVGTQDIKVQVLAYLRDKELLLVFDTFERQAPGCCAGQRQAPGVPAAQHPGHQPRAAARVRRTTIPGRAAADAAARACAPRARGTRGGGVTLSGGRAVRPAGPGRRSALPAR